MRAEIPCCRRTLAQSQSSRVDLCSCGHVHLSIGPVTLRLEPMVLQNIHMVLDQAVEQLRGDHDVDPVPTPGIPAPCRSEPN